MFARSTTLLVDPERIDQGIAHVRDEVWPAVRELQGCAGLSMLVDRAQGKVVVTTSWEDEETLRSSRATVMPLRDRAAEIAGAREAPVVEEWEIAVMHRRHATQPGSFVRVAWSRVPVDQAERAIEFFRHTLVPRMEEMDGFASASLMVDRAVGRGVSSVAFDSREAMEGTRDQADYLRATSTQEVNVEFLEVEEFELALAHLHAPELV